MNMPGGAFGTDYYSASALQAALTAGQITQAQIDNMVYRILRSMFAVGIFDHTYPTPASALNTDVSTPADNQVALTASEQGTVLLKNDRGALPLSPRVSRSPSSATTRALTRGTAAAGPRRSTRPTPSPRSPASPAARPRPATRSATPRATPTTCRCPRCQTPTSPRPRAPARAGPRPTTPARGQRHPARLRGRHQPQRHRHPGHRHHRRRHHLVGRLHRDADPGRHRHRRVRAQRRQRRRPVDRRQAGRQLRPRHRLDLHRPGQPDRRARPFPSSSTPPA